VLIAAFGICARVARTAVDNLRDAGIRAGLFRPVTLWPFPAEMLKEAAAGAKHLLTVEMNAGQMLEDVRAALPGREINFYGRMGGTAVTAGEIEDEVLRMGRESS
jgi:2-oxoglutarate ferredoxin oxidoreductase subunit alpha